MSLLENKTQRFHSLRVPLDNRWSYCKYTIGNKLRNWIGGIWLILFVCSAISLVLDILDLVSGSIWYRVGYVTTFLLSGLLKLVDTAKNYDDRFTHQEPIEDFYKDVAPPDKDWEALDLDMGGGKTERVFRCEAIDQWLRGSEDIKLVRNYDAEKGLKDFIRQHERWQEVFAPFLREMHQRAIYTGKQFYNEEKYGISQELIPGEPVQIHKTCYFDSYLTNISPGHRLLRNRDDAVLVELPSRKGAGWCPYEAVMENGKKVYRLKSLGRYTMANEPGVTTLCIREDTQTIFLWTQNRLALCSTGRLVASGSGSANWKDCEEWIEDENGLRKAVIKGMNRELWEESVGERSLSNEDFYAGLKTRITGYFRWLTKAGKSEFVGVSRLSENCENGKKSIAEYLEAEASEVLDGEDDDRNIQAQNMWVLREELGKRLKKIKIEKGTAHIGFGAGEHTYSVSCSMAMLALQEVCREYCEQHCKKCQKECCKHTPFKVLFEEQNSAEKRDIRGYKNVREKSGSADGGGDHRPQYLLRIQQNRFGYHERLQYAGGAVSAGLCAPGGPVRKETDKGIKPPHSGRGRLGGIYLFPGHGL